MGKRTLALVLAFFLVLSGCIYRGSSDEASYAAVYRRSTADDGGAALVRENVPYEQGEELLDVMLKALNAQPTAVGLGRVFPAGVSIRSCKLENGLATVSMSQDYSKLSEMERILCNSAVTLTLMTVDQVCSVDIKCGERFYARGMTVEDIQQADALFREYERTAKIYLPMEEHSALAPHSISLNVDGSIPMEQLVTGEVLAALPVYTEPTTVISAETTDGICTVDLSEAFFGNEPADHTAGMLIIYSIVNSLCRLNAVDGVVITVEGQTVVSYGGFRAAWPLEANEELIVYQEKTK